MRDPSAEAVVAAAGRGARLGANSGKAFVPLLGAPMLVHTLRALEACPLIQRIVAVVPPERVGDAQALVRSHGVTRVGAVVAGGADRQDSVAAGLAAVGTPEVVVVHDGARPLVRPEVIAAVARAAAASGAASAGIPMRETVKAVEGGVVRTLDRATLWIARTPQAFRTELLRDGHGRARAEGFRGPDDAVLVERLGHPVRMVEDFPANLKITVADDLRLAEGYLRGATGVRTRTGLGVDAHRFTPGRALHLGGVEIPSPRGLAGHSDADVIVHAVMDALLGAAAMGDIGTHFPPGEAAYRGADSLALLRRVSAMLAASGWAVAHVDVAVLAEAPRLAPYLPRMRGRIAEALAIDAGAVSIKATTTEGMGAIGRGEGIAAYAVATITGPL